MKRILHYSMFLYPSEKEAFFYEFYRMGGAKIVRQQEPLKPHSGRSPDPLWDAFSLQLAVDPESWPRIESILDRYEYRRYPDEPRIFREECVFTKNEVDCADLLAVRINRSPLDFIGADEGMEYDWTINPSDDNPAPWCWQRTPRLMKKKDLPKPHVGMHSTIPLEILIHKRLLSVVNGLGYQHVRLESVIASGKPSDWFQLETDRVMPLYHETTTGIKSVTQGRSPRGSPPAVVHKLEEGYWPAYNRNDVVGYFGRIPPIVFTRELEGWWVSEGLDRQIAPPQPRLLVDQQTRRELIAAGVKRLQYIPIRWID